MPLTIGDGWTDERVEGLKALWSDGLSAGQIADELGGGITRNAVIGKVHRLGLDGRAPRAGGGAPAGPRRPKPQVSRPRPTVRHVTAPPPGPLQEPEPSAVPDEPLHAPGEHRATLLELTPDTCRWPVGDPRSADFFFCGAKPSGGVYCGYHDRIAYNGLPERRAAPPPFRR